LALGRHDEILPWLDRAEGSEPQARAGADVRVAGDGAGAAAWRLLGDVRLSGELAEQVVPLDGSSRDHALAADLLGATARWLGDDPRPSISSSSGSLVASSIQPRRRLRTGSSR
jgi:hypothetical protein